MAGHNKWSKVKHIKAKQDAIKGKAFTKAVKDLSIAAREGGADPSKNPALRVAIEKAKAVSMPAKNIQRAIDKATGNLKGVILEDITYEGYGPSGVALIVKCLTDNKNRTVANVRHIFSKFGGNLGENGSVAWMFEKKGIISIKRGKKDDEVLEIALENGALDIHEYDEVVVIESEPNSFNQILTALNSLDIEILESEIALVASNEIDIDDESALKVERLIEALEEDDDVQAVYHNMK